MRFVHIADMHFDAPFTILNDKIGLGEKRRIEQREIFRKIIDYIKKEDIPYLFIAGDLYEQEYVRQNTIEYINEQFKSIPNTKIFITPGNHDPLLNNSYYQKFSWSENVHIFGNQIEKYEYPEADIYGYGFNDFYCTNSEIEKINIKNKEKINILITHSSLDASETLEKQYNPLKKNEIEKIGFSYVALGHIHKTNYTTNNSIIYPGSPISMGFDELGEHGMIVGEINAEKNNLEFIRLDEREFIELEIDISDTFSQEELIEKINQTSVKEKNFYKLILVGTRNFEINLNSILKLISLENIIKIKNNTKLPYNLENIKMENNLRGIFVQELLKQKETSQEKEIIEKAIEIGLDIIETK